jgi:hypothetical protein
MGFLDGSHDSGMLRPPARAQHASTPFRDTPAAPRANKREPGNRHAARGVARLRHERAADRRVGELSMGMPENHHVDSGNLASDARRHVLTREAGRDRVVRGGLGETGMQHDDDDRGTLSARFDYSGVDARHDIAHFHASQELVSVPDHGSGGRASDNGDADAGLRHHRPRCVRVPVVGGVHVGGDKWKGRLRDDPAEVAKPIVELVIADDRRVVAHDVHRGDDRVGTSRVTQRDVRQRRALQVIAGVHEDNSFGVSRSQRIHDRRRPGKAARGVRRAGEIIPPAQPAVDIGGSRDDESQRVRADRRGRGRADGAGARHDAHRQQDEWSHAKN